MPNALEPVFRPDGDAAEGEYVLAVGTLEPRKNLARVVEATARAGVELRLVGEPGWGDAGVSGEHVTWLGRIDDEELAAAYRGARCLVFPSLYEGFGIPALEAMACGTPVVTSAGGATEEVAGERGRARRSRSTSRRSPPGSTRPTGAGTSSSRPGSSGPGATRGSAPSRQRSRAIGGRCA